MAGSGFFLSSWIRFSIAAVGLSALDVAGMGTLVGKKMTVSAGMVDHVTGMNALHCLQCCIAGPAHHPLVPLSDQVVFLLSFGSWAMHLVPSGASGVLLKSNSPKIWWHADGRGLILDLLRRLRVRTVCWMSLHHRWEGKSTSVPLRMEMK